MYINRSVNCIEYFTIWKINKNTATHLTINEPYNIKRNKSVSLNIQ